MRRLVATALLSGPAAATVVALVLAATAFAGPRKVPARLAQARYVCLGFDTGAHRFLSEADSIASAPDVFPEDRRALEAIREEIERWRKYNVTVRPRDAELLIAVRTGRRAGGMVGIGVGGGGDGGRFGPSGGLAGVEVSSGDDLFVIYESQGGSPGAQLWRVRGRGILSGRPPKAFAEFRSDVESLGPPNTP